MTETLDLSPLSARKSHGRVSTRLHSVKQFREKGYRFPGNISQCPSPHAFRTWNLASNGLFGQCLGLCQSSTMGEFSPLPMDKCN